MVLFFVEFRFEKCKKRCFVFLFFYCAIMLKIHIKGDISNFNKNLTCRYSVNKM